MTATKVGACVVLATVQHTVNEVLKLQAQSQNVIKVPANKCSLQRNTNNSCHTNFIFNLLEYNADVILNHICRL